MSRLSSRRCTNWDIKFIGEKEIEVKLIRELLGHEEEIHELLVILFNTIEIDIPKIKYYEDVIIASSTMVDIEDIVGEILEDILDIERIENRNVYYIKNKESFGIYLEDNLRVDANIDYTIVENLLTWKR